MANSNTNEGSFSQTLLGTHRLMSKHEQAKHTPAELKKIRKRKARQKMVDMSPKQKRDELARLKAKKAARLKANRTKVAKAGS